MVGLIPQLSIVKKMTMLETRVELLERLAAATLTHQHISGEPEVAATLSSVSPPMYAKNFEGKPVLTQQPAESLGFARGLNNA